MKKIINFNGQSSVSLSLSTLQIIKVTAPRSAIDILTTPSDFEPNGFARFKIISKFSPKTRGNWFN